MTEDRKAKLGAKWICFACSAKFYDLGKPEALCPKCGKDQRDSPARVEPKKRRSRAKAKAAETVVAQARPPPPRPQDTGIEVEVDSEDDLDDLTLDDEDEFALSADDAALEAEGEKL